MPEALAARAERAIVHATLLKEQRMLLHVAALVNRARCRDTVQGSRDDRGRRERSSRDGSGIL
jgi:hypothetical protein